MNELKLGNTAYQYGMDTFLLIEPVNHFRHHDRDIICRRRGINSLSGHGVNDIVLYLPVFTRSRGTTSYTIHKTLVNLTDKPH